MYSAIACTILPRISPTIDFYAYSVTGSLSNKLGNIPLLRFNGCSTVRCALSAGTIRTSGSTTPTDHCDAPHQIIVQWVRSGRPGGSVALDGVTISELFLPASWLGLDLQKLRATASSSRQLNEAVFVTTSRLCHFDAPVVTLSTVSWSRVRRIGPFTDHMRQTFGSGTLNLLIYNLVAQNEAGPDLTQGAVE